MNRDEEVFAEVLDLPAADRAAHLDRACAGDAGLRERILALLAGHAEAERAMPRALFSRIPTVSGEKPSDRIGRYKLLEKIGEGGCGVVWMAEQEEPVRRRVALKVIKLGMDTKAVIARFEAERQALALMDHPNIARVFDAGATESGRPFFVMELVRGVPITTYCDRHHLPPKARLHLFISVCAAIHHAHQKGIIHRDIKPSNILVTVNDGIAVPKVIDFGIAKATQGRLTEQTLFTAFEQFIGTPDYMSPEQAEMSSVEIDPRSDVYSLGVLLYELLTGQRPFKALARTGVDEIRRQIREVEPPRPSTRWRTLTDAEQTSAANLRGTAPATLSLLLRGDLDWIVMCCIEKERARRYESPITLAADLERHLRHEPVQARPPSRAYVLSKFVRRHRVPVTAVAAVLVVLSIAAAVSLGQARRAVRAEQLAASRATGPSPDARSEAAQTAAQAYAITQRLDYTRDDLALAGSLAQRATELDPAFGRAWAVRSWVQAAYAMRNWDVTPRKLQEIQTLANRALGIDPRDADALNARYVVLEKQRLPEEAQKIARRAVAAAPDNYRSHLSLGRALDQLGRREEAFAVLNEAVRRFPDKVICRYELANHYVSVGQALAPVTPAAVAATLEQIDATLATQPFSGAVVLKAAVMGGWRGDLAAMRREIDYLATMPISDRTEDRAVFMVMWAGLLEREPERVLTGARLSARPYFEDRLIAGPKAWGTALAYRLAGKDSLARQEWLVAEAILRQRMQDEVADQLEPMRLAATLAWLERPDEATQLAEPLEAAWREDMNWTRARFLALYYGARGDAAKAAPYLRQAINLNSLLTDYTLPLDPWWDKLRGQPEFEEILRTKGRNR